MADARRKHAARPLANTEWARASEQTEASRGGRTLQGLETLRRRPPRISVRRHESFHWRFFLDVDLGGGRRFLRRQRSAAVNAHARPGRCDRHKGYAGGSAL